MSVVITPGKLQRENMFSVSELQVIRVRNGCLIRSFLSS